MERKDIKRELQLTADGSHTLFVPSMDEHYHSVNGAIQESRHVFIEAGLYHLQKEHIRILEIGFGTGLNALLTMQVAETKDNCNIEYHSVELYPLGMDVVRALNYGRLIWPEREEVFEALHTAAWNEPAVMSDRFTLLKIMADSNTCELPSDIDLIYFDAFAPEKQPEMWTPELFGRLYEQMASGGVIVTYCAKGEVRRGMQAAGFMMSRLPGPPGKRHMLRGEKV